MMSPPPTHRNSRWYVSRSWPITVAEAPNRMNTVETPAMNSRAFWRVLHLTRKRSSPRVSSSSDRPVTYETYAGTSGNTHGETNERNPAENAMASEGAAPSMPPLLRAPRRGRHGRLGGRPVDRARRRAMGRGCDAGRTAGLGDERPHEILALHRRPIHRPEELVANDPLPVENDRRRDGPHFKAVVDGHLGVQQDRERQAERLDERLHDLRAFVIARNADHHELLGRKLARERLEGRHLRAAGTAPRRPEVDQHHFPAEFGRGGGSTLEAFERKGRREKPDPGALTGRGGLDRRRVGGRGRGAAGAAGGERKDENENQAGVADRHDDASGVAIHAPSPD